MMITFTFDKNFIRQAQVPKDPKQLNKNQIVCSFSLVFCFVFFSDQRKSIKFVSKVKVIVSIFINLTLIRDYPGSSENSVNHCNPFPFSDNHMLNLTIISLELISYVIQITITFLVVLFFYSYSQPVDSRECFEHAWPESKIPGVLISPLRNSTPESLLAGKTSLLSVSLSSVVAGQLELTAQLLTSLLRRQPLFVTQSAVTH